MRLISSVDINCPYGYIFYSVAYIYNYSIVILFFSAMEIIVSMIICTDLFLLKSPCIIYYVVGTGADISDPLLL